MSKLMLIDATHPEETRVAVVANGQIEDFDFEARNKRQLRGNIYLAKVTRVEPSLQAAFVDYGGNRHGFLAFSEIHPDYYQIPKEDREALLAEADQAEDEDADGEDEDAEEENERKQNRRNAFFQRKYKIQEVIRRRQVMLVQVVKEERGNKGAALTTYLSLAGRYCVLMPNTSRGGGISRKITNVTDRKRLKAITSEFEIPRGAGLIVRTAGGKRTKSEIRRDFEYLTKLWQQIVGKTMESMAPALIHEEGHLVLRAVRDLYDKDVERIIVEGEDAYNEARTFVKMLMPSHTRKVVLHDDNGPLFVSTGIEDQLESIFSPTVQLAIRRLHRHQPDRGAGRHRRQLGQGHARAQRRIHRPQDQHGSRRRSLPPDAPARPCRPHRDRFHRHGGQQEQPRRRKADEGFAEDRPRPRADRPHLAVWPV